MNEDKMKGKWNVLKGEIKRKWGRVTDNDLLEAEGNLDKLIGKIQERSGERKESIERWLKSQGYRPADKPLSGFTR
jgi:uncharacterized protein YjbJ (UPF0337 family)